MKFLIIGHPKTGSKYMSKLMFEFGYKVGHEERSDNGICCWQNVNVLPQFKQYYGPLRAPKDFYDTIIHHVRNPYHSIPSIILENRSEESYNFRREVIKHHFGIDLDDYSEIDAASVSYIYYNRLAEAQAPHVRIQVESALEQVAEHLKVKVPLAGPPTNINTSGIRKPEVDWMYMSPQVYKLLNETCKRYGYPSLAESKLGIVT